MKRKTFHARHIIDSGNKILGSLIDPIDGLSEAIFSILVFLTFTLAFKIFWLSERLEQPISKDMTEELLLGALGAILAWSIIDGVYVHLTRHAAAGRETSPAERYSNCHNRR